LAKAKFGKIQGLRCVLRTDDDITERFPSSESMVETPTTICQNVSVQWDKTKQLPVDLTIQRYRRNEITVIQEKAIKGA
jgi:hypothetical protein